MLLQPQHAGVVGRGRGEGMAAGVPATLDNLVRVMAASVRDWLQISHVCKQKKWLLEKIGQPLIKSIKNCIKTVEVILYLLLTVHLAATIEQNAWT